MIMKPHRQGITKKKRYARMLKPPMFMPRIENMVVIIEITKARIDRPMTRPPLIRARVLEVLR
jgi:hypothetical protein